MFSVSQMGLQSSPSQEIPNAIYGRRPPTLKQAS